MRAMSTLPKYLAAVAVACVLGVAVGLWLRPLAGGDAAGGFLPAMASRPAVGDAGTPLYVARYETTWAEWRRCYDAGGCSYLPRPAMPAADGAFPVVGVNALDVAEYVAWIGKVTGHPFRLPSITEWYGFAPELKPAPSTPLFTDPRLAWAASYSLQPLVPKQVRSSGSFGHAAGGIYDLAGNVWEWTSSCTRPSTYGPEDPCPAYALGGLHEAALSLLIRNPAAGGCALGTPPANLGFRLVSDRAFEDVD
jgi:formylglycine-generating enzyme required for sulfatase activity